MPIRVEHQVSPAAVGMAGYAIGQGARRQRQQKYALDLFSQDKAIRARRDEQFAYQNAQANRENSREANRAMTLGYSAAVQSLPPIPEHADAQTRRRLGNLHTTAAELAGGTYGHGNNVREPLDEVIEEYNTIVSSIPELDRAEEATKNLILFNPDTGERAPFGSERKPGMETYDVSSGRLEPFEQRPSEAEMRKSIEQEMQGKRQETWDSAELKERRAVAEEAREAAIEEKKRNPKSNVKVRPLSEYLNDPDIIKESTGRMVIPRPGGSTASGGAVGTPGVTGGSQSVDVQMDESGFLQSPNQTAPAPEPAASTRPQVLDDIDQYESQKQGGQMSVEDQITQSRQPQAPAGTQQYSQGELDELFGTKAPQQPEDFVFPETVPIMPTSMTQPTTASAPNDAQQQDRMDRMRTSSTGRSPEQQAEALDRLSASEFMDVKKMFMNGNEAIRNALRGRYGDVFSTREDLDERYPDEQFGIPNAEPRQAVLADHVEAMRGRQGTGEGIRSDADSIAGGIEGAGGMEGRLQRKFIEDASRGEGLKRVVYDTSITDDESSRASLDERNAYAKRRAAERAAERESGVASAPATTKSRGRRGKTQTEIDLERQNAMNQGDVDERGQNIAARKQELDSRKLAARAQGIERGFASGRTSAAKLKQMGIGIVRSDAEYDAIPEGSEFIGPDGKLRKKPKWELGPDGRMRQV